MKKLYLNFLTNASIVFGQNPYPRVVLPLLLQNQKGWRWSYMNTQTQPIFEMSWKL